MSLEQEQWESRIDGALRHHGKRGGADQMMARFARMTWQAFVENGNSKRWADRGYIVGHAFDLLLVLEEAQYDLIRADVLAKEHLELPALSEESRQELAIRRKGLLLANVISEEDLQSLLVRSLESLQEEGPHWKYRCLIAEGDNERLHDEVDSLDEERRRLEEERRRLDEESS